MVSGGGDEAAEVILSMWTTTSSTHLCVWSLGIYRIDRPIDVLCITDGFGRRFCRAGVLNGAPHYRRRAQ